MSKLYTHVRAKELNKYPYMVTKRGNKVQGNRSNKTAVGITKTITDQKRNTRLKRDVEILSVYGTLDILRGGTLKFLIKKIKVEHPIDKGYYKEIYVLNDMGKLHHKVRRNKIKIMYCDNL